MKKISKSEHYSHSYTSTTFKTFENKLKLSAPSKKSLAEFHCKDSTSENLVLTNEDLPCLKPSKSLSLLKKQNSCIDVSY